MWRTEWVKFAILLRLSTSLHCPHCMTRNAIILSLFPLFHSNKVIFQQKRKHSQITHCANRRCCACNGSSTDSFCKILSKRAGKLVSISSFPSIIFPSIRKSPLQQIINYTMHWHTMVCMKICWEVSGICSRKRVCKNERVIDRSRRDNFLVCCQTWQRVVCEPASLSISGY